MICERCRTEFECPFCGPDNDALSPETEQALQEVNDPANRAETHKWARIERKMRESILAEGASKADERTTIQRD